MIPLLLPPLLLLLLLLLLPLSKHLMRQVLSPVQLLLSTQATFSVPRLLTVQWLILFLPHLLGLTLLHLLGRH